MANVSILQARYMAGNGSHATHGKPSLLIQRALSQYFRFNSMSCQIDDIPPSVPFHVDIVHLREFAACHIPLADENIPAVTAETISDNKDPPHTRISLHQGLETWPVLLREIPVTSDLLALVKTLGLFLKVSTLLDSLSVWLIQSRRTPPNCPDRFLVCSVATNGISFLFISLDLLFPFSSRLLAFSSSLQLPTLLLPFLQTFLTTILRLLDQRKAFARCLRRMYLLAPHRFCRLDSREAFLGLCLTTDGTSPTYFAI